MLAPEARTRASGAHAPSITCGIVSVVQKRAEARLKRRGRLRAYFEYLGCATLPQASDV